MLSHLFSTSPAAFSKCPMGAAGDFRENRLLGHPNVHGDVGRLAVERFARSFRPTKATDVKSFSFIIITYSSLPILAARFPSWTNKANPFVHFRTFECLLHFCAGAAEIPEEA
jgi:hypothetical protein